MIEELLLLVIATQESIALVKLSKYIFRNKFMNSLEYFRVLWSNSIITHCVNNNVCISVNKKTNRIIYNIDLIFLGKQQQNSWQGHRLKFL